MKRKEILEKRLALIEELNSDKGFFSDLWFITIFGDGSGSISCHVYSSSFEGETLHKFFHFLDERGYRFYLMRHSVNLNLMEIHVTEKREEE